MLDGGVAIVTGGSGGIGRGVVAGLLDANVKVAIISDRQGELDEAVKALGGKATLRAYMCDITSEPATDQVIAEIDDALGGVDILVCCHGIHQSHPFLELPLADWHRTMDVNVTATFVVGRAVASTMVKRGTSGRIINISSTNGFTAEPMCADYTTSKAAVHGLTRAMAVDLAPHHITVNAVAPGWIQTPLSAHYFEDNLKAKDVTFNLVRRWGQPADIAGAVLWLANPASSFVTGSIIVVDGGQTAMAPMPT